MQFARCLLGAIFLHRLDNNANRHLRRPCFLVSFLLEFWPDLEVSVRYRFPAQAHGMLSGRQSKIYLNIGSNSYDFCVSVCLELSVWSCLCSCLFGAVCLELSVCNCLFGAFCLSVRRAPKIENEPGVQKCSKHL